MLKAELVEK